MKLNIKSKRWLLIIHILFAAIMLGNMVTFLILSITAAASTDPAVIEACYQVMNVLSRTSVKASTFGAAISGILLSVLTKWGLFNYYWIIFKEGLTLLAIGLNIWAMYDWTLQSITFLRAGDGLDLYVTQTKLVTGIIIQITALILMYIVSVFKPWGKRQVNT